MAFEVEVWERVMTSAPELLETRTFDNLQDALHQRLWRNEWVK